MKYLFYVMCVCLIFTCKAMPMASCSSVKAALCPVVQTESASLSAAVAGACGCDQAAVEVDFFNALNVIQVCTVAVPVGGVVGQYVCPEVIGLVIGAVGNAAAKSSWKCTSVPACLGGVNAVLTLACNAIPFRPQGFTQFVQLQPQELGEWLKTHQK